MEENTIIDDAAPAPETDPVVQMQGELDKLVTQLTNIIPALPAELLAQLYTRILVELINKSASNTIVDILRKSV